MALKQSEMCNQSGGITDKKDEINFKYNAKMFKLQLFDLVLRTTMSIEMFP